MDSGMRWTEHIRTLKIKTTKYMNILKWLSGRSWGIDPLQAINFINATIVAQLMWGGLMVFERGQKLSEINGLS